MRITTTDNVDNEVILGVGDTVEVIHGGMGIGALNIGRRTIITAVNGRYSGEPDAVQTKDFKNPEFGDWVSKRSFKLIKAAKRLSFKAGDRVAVMECEEIKHWSNTWREAIGKIYTLNKSQAFMLTRGYATGLGDNEYAINYSARMLEKLRR